MLENEMKISLTLVAFDKMSKVLRDAVHKSNEEFTKLQNKIQQTSEMLDKLGTNMVKLGAGLIATGGALAYKLGITEAIPEALALEHQLRELGNVGQLSAEQLKEMDERLGSISRHTNQFRSEIAEGLNVLVASGIAPEKALDYMNVIGRTATAAQAEIVDISKTAFAVTDNLKVNVDDLAKTMDILAQAGKEGRFELKDMSAAFPSLTAGASMLGMRGVPAVSQLGAALQVAMKGAGSAAEAATNFESFLQAITSPMAVNRFKELYGVDLPQFLNRVIAENKDPIEEMVMLINQLTGGDVFKVSEIFRNKTDLNFLKPMMQNLDEYRRIKASALGADGIMDEDFNHMMETTNEQFKLLKINMKELVFPHLHKPIEKINQLLTAINKNPLLQKGIFTAIIGTIGAGIVLTTLGTATILVGKLVKGYGAFLSVARDLTPVLVQNGIKLLNFIGLNSTAHNLTFGYKIKQSGDKLGLASAFSLKGGLMADIRRIDKNLKEGIVRSFKELPSNIAKSTVALKDWTVTSIKSIPTNIMLGLNGIKTAFLGLPSMISRAIIAFRAFSVTLLTSPIGWIALAIGAVALVIYKYWKPITAFFKGMWQGLKEGLQPLMPVFNKLGVALSPILKPIQQLWNWIKKLFKPVDDVGGAAENMGVKFGRAIASVLVMITKFIVKLVECGIKIPMMIAKGILSGVGKVTEAIKKVTQSIRDHLPHSPAKTGPLKDLHKIKISETIATAIKPKPISSAIANALNLNSYGLKPNVRGGISGGSTVIHYNPTININGGNNQAKHEFSQMLKQHKDEILRIFKQENERQLRLAY